MIYGDRSNTDGMARAGTVVPRAPVRKVVDTIGRSSFSCLQYGTRNLTKI